MISRQPQNTNDKEEGTYFVARTLRSGSARKVQFLDALQDSKHYRGTRIFLEGPVEHSLSHEQQLHLPRAII
eukprot:8302119-Prorocentrum_lima.AAC.1